MNSPLNTFIKNLLKYTFLASITQKYIKPEQRGRNILLTILNTLILSLFKEGLQKLFALTSYERCKYNGRKLPHSADPLIF